jgi:predicted nucleic acid-binding protein
LKILIDSSVFVAAFDRESASRGASIALLDELKSRKQLISMPAHAWFEIECSLRRLRQEKKFLGPTIKNRMDYPIELIHIDNQFIQKYKGADVPYIKAGDHIFLAVAKINNYPLVTRDLNMSKVANNCGIAVFTPESYLVFLKNNAQPGTPPDASSGRR